MKRLFRLPMLPALLGVTWAGTFLSGPLGRANAQDDTFIRRPYYFGGPHLEVGEPGHGYTSSYGYADPAPGAPIAPSYRGYGLGNGFGTGGTYRGVYGAMVDHSYGRWRYYRQPTRPAYVPQGPETYGPYGFRLPHDYGY